MKGEKRDFRREREEKNKDVVRFRKEMKKKLSFLFEREPHPRKTKKKKARITKREERGNNKQ
jgi:ribosomal protein S8E